MNRIRIAWAALWGHAIIYRCEFQLHGHRIDINPKSKGRHISIFENDFDGQLTIK